MIFVPNLGTEQAKYAAKYMELVCPTMKINNPGSFDLINKGREMEVTLRLLNTGHLL